MRKSVAIEPWQTTRDHWPLLTISSVGSGHVRIANLLFR